MMERINLIQRIEEECWRIKKASRRGNFIVVAPWVYQLLVECGFFVREEGCLEGVF
jgi:hypothetical protein